MTNHNPDRLDRIEVLLERFIETSVADHQASNERLTRLEHTVQELTQDVKENTAATKDLRAAVETQKVIVDEVIDQLVTVRDENKRILEYLFGQRRDNGHDDQREP
jgi:predicted transcriptional regulator YheO